MSRHIPLTDFLLGRHPPGSERLPARVRQLIAAEEATAERLIGWVQLTVVTLFATLYLAAPRPDDAPASMLFDPVPLVLAGYAVFTAGRLALSFRGPLPGAMLAASIAADVGLLMALIWMFHGQYGQEPAFSLKVPTFIYLFVFIAVRAVRFDARYVIFAGLAAALAWAGLVASVVWAGGTQSITRSFTAYMSGSKVLLGAEVEKVATLLLVTGVLALAVARARRLFVAAVRGEAAVSDLSQFLGHGVSDTVVGAEARAEAGLAHERDAAILMLDIRGFTALAASRPPQQVVTLLTRLHARIIPVIRAHNGVIDKFLGDGLMVTFGAVKPSNRAAAEALAAVDAVMEAARRWEADVARDGEARPLAVNGAVVAGQVVFAVVGAGARLEYTVIGEAVNLAAKLEKHNKVERTRVLTTAETFAMALAQGYRQTARHEARAGCEIAGAGAAADLVVLA